jgi:hypothetical protein
MAKYRKKPIVVEATQWFYAMNPETYPEGVQWSKSQGCYYVVTIHEQKAWLDEGDWVITESDGVHHYPCKPDVFAVTYEAV